MYGCMYIHRDSIPCEYIYIYTYIYISTQHAHVHLDCKHIPACIEQNALYMYILVYMCTLLVHKHIYIYIVSLYKLLITDSLYTDKLSTYAPPHYLDISTDTCTASTYTSWCMKVCLVHLYFTIRLNPGWWVGTLFIFPIKNHHPNWHSYFSEGLTPPTRSGFAGTSRLSNMGTGLWSGAQIKRASAVSKDWGINSTTAKIAVTYFMQCMIKLENLSTGRMIRMSVWSWYSCSGYTMFGRWVSCAVFGLIVPVLVRGARIGCVWKCDVNLEE